VPDDGAATVTGTTIGPVPDDWTPAGEGCPSPAPTLPANGPSLVTLRMPTTPGNDYEFTLEWSRTGTTGLTGMSTITFQVDVVPNTPPKLSLPADLTVEATSAAGATVTYSASATDAEDATAPTPTCSPASGSTFPLGTATVNCTVTDGGGLTDKGSFKVTVQDTTAPVMPNVADFELTTTDPTGTMLEYGYVSLVEAVDPSPTVVCLPASGSKIPVGTTTVTCTATDASGNSSTRTFHVTVVYAPLMTWSAVWGEPVATTGDTFATNTSRTIPVKVEILADGVERSSGSAVLSVVSCAGGTPMTMPLNWDGNRWSGHLDASSLGGPGCYRVTASLDGNAAGSFRLDIRGGATPSAKPAKTKP